MASHLPMKDILTRAFVVEKPGAPFVMTDIVLDEVRDDEVLVEMKYTGLCHTDIVVQLGGMAAGAYPAIVGHEGAGIVRRVGAGVKDQSLHEGQPVLLSFNSCGQCTPCREGLVSNCLDMARINFTGTRLTDGSTPARLQDGTAVRGQFFGQSSFSKLAVVHERSVIACDLPETDMAMLASLGCGYQTGAGTVLNVLRPTKTTRMAILGLGAVGIAALLAARSEGVETIIAGDRLGSKLVVASELGATAVINMSEQTDLKAALTAFGGADQIVDTTGVADVIAQGIRALNHGGTMALIGTPKPDTPIQVDPMDMLLSVKTVMGVIEGRCNPAQFIPRLIQLYQKGRFPVDRLGKIYPVSSIADAIRDMGQGSVIKPILSWEGV